MVVIIQKTSQISQMVIILISRAKNKVSVLLNNIIEYKMNKNLETEEIKKKEQNEISKTCDKYFPFNECSLSYSRGSTN